MPLTKIQEGSIEAGAINTTDLGANVTATYATFAALAANLTPKITTVNVANSAYTILDDTSVNTSGGYLVITGANFQSGAIVTIDTTNATSTTFVNSTILRAQVSSKSAGSYNLYVTNPDGGTAIKVLGVSFSNTPVWGTSATLSNQPANTAFGVNVSANSDSNVTYSNTTTLPAGTQLLSNGYFYGTVTIGAETTYTFTVNAVDAENQDTPREFSLTVTVTPQYELWVWGTNDNGQLGLNDTPHRSSPVQIGSGANWNSVGESTGYHWVANTPTGGLFLSGGYNYYGHLGQNDRVYKSSPVQVGTGTNWKEFSSGSYMTIATKTDGTLWTWGSNTYGQLGLGDRINKSSPTQVGSATNWKLVQGAPYGSVAVKTDNSLWIWGMNTQGQLGLNDTTHRSSPTQVGSGTNWDLISPGTYVTLGKKTDGTLWIWGNNGDGQLGLGDTTLRSSPVQVGSGTTWNNISGGFYFSSATKTDGTLWTWGSGFNSEGVLGHNDRINKSSPTQVGSNTNWSKISAGGYFILSIKTDGTLWSWGLGGFGRLGLNSIESRSSPTQVGASNKWVNITALQGAAVATKTL